MALRFLLLFLFAVSVLRAADYEDVTIANAVARATISTQRAALLRLDLLTEHPIRLPSHASSARSRHQCAWLADQ